LVIVVAAVLVQGRSAVGLSTLAYQMVRHGSPGFCVDLWKIRHLCRLRVVALVVGLLSQVLSSGTLSFGSVGVPARGPARRRTCRHSSSAPEAALSRSCGTSAEPGGDCLKTFEAIGARNGEVSDMAKKVQDVLPGYSQSSFDGIDVDGNGVVSKAEFAAAFKNVGLGLSEFFIDNVLFFIGDTDRSGGISRSELDVFVRIGDSFAKQLSGT